MMEVTAELLARHLNAGRVGYAEAYPDGRNFNLQTGWAQGDMQRLTGSMWMESFGSDLLPGLRAGRTMIYTDVQAELQASDAAAFENLGIRAAIVVPLLRNANLRGMLYVNDSSAREWTRRRYPWHRKSRSEQRKV